MEKREVACDQCGSNLTTTGNCVDYRIVLANENIPTWGGAVTAMGKYPPLDDTCHFCGTACLAKWVSEAYPNGVAEYDRLVEHRAKMAART